MKRIRKKKLMEEEGTQNQGRKQQSEGPIWILLGGDATSFKWHKIINKRR
jgi:hypothetical protein